MGDKSVAVRVTGLIEIRRELRAISDEAGVELKVGLRAIAERIAAKVASRVPHGPTGRAAASVKARASQTGAGIAVGGTKAPYFPWLDFGGWVGRGHDTTKRRARYDRTLTSATHASKGGSIYREWMGKPFGEGRYLYPTIRDESPAIRHDVDELMEALIRSHDLDQRGSN